MSRELLSEAMGFTFKNEIGLDMFYYKLDGNGFSFLAKKEKKNPIIRAYLFFPQMSFMSLQSGERSFT